MMPQTETMSSELAHPTVAGHAVDDLRRRVRGALLLPTNAGYDDARRIWNGAIDRRPALIVRCADANNVVEAVRFARQHELLVAVRGGGHAVAGHAVCDGGLMIDLSLMRTVTVDAAQRTARADGGALWGEFDRATQAHGLATTGGFVSHTGIGGLTLGGGLGHLMRRLGLTVDNLRSVELVTADGEQLHVDAEHDPELFWGLRGGGGNFGVATSFEYQLHPIGPLVLGGPIFWGHADGRAVLEFLRDFAPDAPDELGIAVTARLAPPLPFMPHEHVGRPVLGLMLVWTGDMDAGERVLAPIRALGSPIADVVRPTPYVSLQSLSDAGNPHGMHYYWKSQRLPVLSDAVIDTMLACVETITAPMSYVAGFLVGGAVSRVAPEATAIGARANGTELNIVAAWQPSDPHGQRHVAWVRDAWQRLRPHSTGVYANFLSDEGQAGVEFAYGARLARLTALKDRYDPSNVFRLNANIPPTQRS
jgi:FAD/FMN-containing dehydrogenase